MARLIASEVLGDLPILIGGVTLTAVNRGPETLIAPFRGRETVSAMRPLGLYYPAPNTFDVAGDAEFLWAGNGRALLIGVAPPADLQKGAALTDQTGAHAVILLTGDGIEDVLARMAPVDLRVGVFPVGTLALTLLGHMTATVRRTQAGIEVAVMRSMAQTLVDELAEAATLVAARSELG